MPLSYFETEKLVQDACQGLDNNTYATIAEASRETGAPYHRVRARYNGRDSRSTRLPTNRLLSNTEEQGLLIWIEALNKLGTRPSKRMLEKECNHLLAEHHPDPATLPPRCGEQWATRFLERHPQIKLRTDRSREIQREAAEDVETLEEWFVKFHAARRMFNIQDPDLYNFDETPIRLGQADSALTIALSDDPDPSTGRLINRESCTVGECISADGFAIDPLIILKGLVIYSGWMNTRLTDDTLLAMSETAYINDDISLAWIQHFDSATAKRQVGRYRMLLFDGHTTHLTKELLRYVDEHDIVIFLTPPHLTQRVQPLDVGVFSPYKHWYSEAVIDSYLTGCDKFNKMEFLDRIQAIRVRALKPTTIQRGWRDAGLIPFNPDLVLEPLRRRAHLHPSTPSIPSTPSSQPTPRSGRTLAKSIQSHLDIIKAGAGQGEILFGLEKILDGAKQIAQANHYLTTTLARVSAAQKRRKRLSTGPKGVLQTGGIVKVRDGRKMVSERMERDKQAKKRREDAAWVSHCRGILKQIKDEIKQGLKERGASITGKKGLHEFTTDSGSVVPWDDVY